MNNPSESIQAYLRTIRRCGRWFCYRSAIELSMNWLEINLTLRVLILSLVIVKWHSLP